FYAEIAACALTLRTEKRFAKSPFRQQTRLTLQSGRTMSPPAWRADIDLALGRKTAPIRCDAVRLRAPCPRCPRARRACAGPACNGEGFGTGEPVAGCLAKVQLSRRNLLELRDPHWFDQREPSQNRNATHKGRYNDARCRTKNGVNH